MFANNKELLALMAERPALYAPSTAPFWADEHISACMLEAHLAPDVEAASRTFETIDRSTAWIGDLLTKEYGASCALIDLGCGPGLYTQRLAPRFARVDGIDLSPRSINYAKEQAKALGLNIGYTLGSYTETPLPANTYNAATLIYCDYGVLPTADRATLLKNVYQALKPGGLFLMDTFTPAQHKGKEESTDWYYSKDPGFWSAKPHACIHSFLLYPEASTALDHYILLEEDNTQVYNIWDTVFTPDTLTAELTAAGFTAPTLYGDVTGAPYDPESNLFCITARKP